MANFDSIIHFQISYSNFRKDLSLDVVEVVFVFVFVFVFAVVVEIVIVAAIAVDEVDFGSTSLSADLVGSLLDCCYLKNILNINIEHNIKTNTT